MKREYLLWNLVYYILFIRIDKLLYTTYFRLMFAKLLTLITILAKLIRNFFLSLSISNDSQRQHYFKQAILQKNLNYTFFSFNDTF